MDGFRGSYEEVVAHEARLTAGNRTPREASRAYLLTQVPGPSNNSSGEHGKNKIFAPFSGCRTPGGLLKGSRNECAAQVMAQASSVAAERRAVVAKEAEVVAFLTSIGLQEQFWPSFHASGLITMAKVISFDPILDNLFFTYFK